MRLANAIPGDARPMARAVVQVIAGPVGQLLIAGGVGQRHPVGATRLMGHREAGPAGQRHLPGSTRR